MSDYKLEINDDSLLFETASFKAERGSILHSGIYNRELASSLAASACITLLGFFFAGRVKPDALSFVSALSIFLALFLAFRTFLFRDVLLGVIVDKGAGAVKITVKNLLGTRGTTFPLTALEDIRQDYTTIAPENPDGVRLVEMISLQHGTVIPGFGKTLEFYTVGMEFKGGKSFIIYSSNEPSRVEHIHKSFKDFLNTQLSTR